MNYKLVFRLLGRLLLMEAILMVPSLFVALIFRQGDAMAFVYTILLTAACGAALLAFILIIRKAGSHNNQ